MKLFEVMQFMADNNLDISRADTFVSGKSVKQGAEITMGTDLNALIKVQTGSYIPVLFFINENQYKLLSEDVTDIEKLKAAK